MKTFRKILRKQKHINYISNVIIDLHIEMVNTCLIAESVGWTDETSNRICVLARLIKKYERRKRLIKY